MVSLVAQWCWRLRIFRLVVLVFDMLFVSWDFPRSVMQHRVTLSPCCFQPARDRDRHQVKECVAAVDSMSFCSAACFLVLIIMSIFSFYYHVFVSVTLWIEHCLSYCVFKLFFSMVTHVRRLTFCKNCQISFSSSNGKLNQTPLCQFVWTALSDGGYCFLQSKRRACGEFINLVSWIVNIFGLCVRKFTMSKTVWKPTKSYVRNS